VLPLCLSAGALAQETAVLRGKVQVMRRDEGGKLVPAGDASGVVIYVTGFTQEPPDEIPVVRQKFKSFVLPEGRGGAFRALPITRGQKVDFVNDDLELHNVFSNSKPPGFDLGKKAPREREKIRFGKEGVWDVFCDIHEQMAMTVLVLPNRAWAISGKDGSFELKGVPRGAHEVRAWMRWAEVPEPVRVAVPAAEPISLRLVQARPEARHLDKYNKSYDTHQDAYQKLIQSTRPGPGAP